MLHRLRRFAAALAGVLLLQLTLLGVGAACATPPAGPQAGSVVAAGAHDDGHHAAHDGHAAEAPRERQAPRGPASGDAPPHHDGRLHCPSATSCAGIAIAATTAAAADPGPRRVARVGARDAERPASVVGAPEPPPPRG